MLLMNALPFYKQHVVLVLCLLVSLCCSNKGSCIVYVFGIDIMFKFLNVSTVLEYVRVCSMLHSLQLGGVDGWVEKNQAVACT